MKDGKLKPEIGVMVGALLAAIATYFVRNQGPEDSFIGFKTLALGTIAGAFILATVGCLLVAIGQRRPLRTCVAFGGLCWGLVLLLGKPFDHDRVWGESFVLNRASMAAAIRRDQTKVERDDAASIPLPKPYRKLAREGEMIKYRDSEGATWFLFLQYIAGVDNGFGFAWSAKDTPPPESAYPQIVRTKPLGDGWYMFWST